MAPIPDLFTLHPEYEDFVPGKDQPPISIEALSPRVNTLEGCATNVFLGSIGILFMLILGFGAVAIAMPELPFTFEGKITTASVVSCRVERGLKSSSTIVSYTYRVSDVEYSDSSGVAGTCADYPSGTRLHALYLSYDPSNSYIPQDRVDSSLGLLLAIGAVYGTVILYGTWRALHPVYLYRYARRNRARLATQGTLLEGRLLEIDAEQHQGGYYIRAGYSFETPRKRIVRRVSEARRDDLKGKELPPLGTPVIVLYADNGSHMML